MLGRSSLPLVASLLLITGLILRANTISPGQSGITPDVFPLSDFTVIATSGVQDFSFDGGLTTGQYKEFVATDTANPYCSGCLDFGFLVDVTDPNNFIGTIGLSPFFGFDTNGGYTASGPNENNPTSMYRGPSGGIVGFNFSEGVLPGQSSSVLVVKTNATSYDDKGGATIFDDNGQSLNVAEFEPVATPEPSSTAVLLGIGVLMVAWVRKRLAVER